MISLVALVAIVVLLGILFLSTTIDTNASVTDTSIPDDEVTASEADKSDSASTTITITMYAVANE